MKVKRILSLVVTFLMIATMAAIPTYAADYNFSLETNAVDGIIPTEGTLVVSLIYDAPATTGFSLDFTFDETALTYVSSEFGEAADASIKNIIVDDVATGKIVFIASGANSAPGAGESKVWATVTFTTAAEESDEELGLALTEGEVVYSAGMDAVDNANVAITGTSVRIRPVHVAPTFNVAITGDAIVGQELGVSITDFEDNYDLTPAYTYQWKADGENIVGETDETYTIIPEDEGAAISVAVTATVEADVAPTATVTSEPTAAVVFDETAEAEVALLVDAIPARDLKVNTTLVATAYYEFTPSVNGGEDASIITWTISGGDLEEAVVETENEITLDKEWAGCAVELSVEAKGSNDTASAEAVVVNSGEEVIKKSAGTSNPIGGAPLAGTTPSVEPTTEPTVEPTDEPTDEPTVEPKPAAKLIAIPAETLAWAGEAINALVEAGVINGVSDVEFAPEVTTTKAHFITMVARAIGLVEIEEGVEDWSASAIAAMSEAGYLDFLGDFDKDSTIAREEMATLLYTIALAKEVAFDVTGVEAFGDADEAADFAKDAIPALQSVNILNGMGDGTYAPKAETTRAQAAKVTYLFSQLIAD